MRQIVMAYLRQPSRTRVNVELHRYRRRRVVHGRRPPYVALPGQTPSTHDICVGAAHSLPTIRRRGPRATAPSCLSVDTPNETARALYERLGFQDAARMLRIEIDALLDS